MNMLKVFDTHTNQFLKTPKGLVKKVKQGSKNYYKLLDAGYVVNNGQINLPKVTFKKLYRTKLDDTKIQTTPITLKYKQVELPKVTYTKEYKNKLVGNESYAIPISVEYNDQSIVTEQDAENIIDEYMSKGPHIVKIIHNDGREQGFGVTQDNRDFLKNIIMNKAILNEVNNYGSDNTFQVDIHNIRSYEFIPAEHTHREKYGALFPFINTSSLDLSRYQIYTQDQLKTTNNKQCLIHCLEAFNISSLLIETVIIRYKSNNIAKSELKTIAEICNIQINLYSYDNAKIRKTSFGKGAIVNIAIYQNHYFIKEKTKYSKYFIDNYDLLKDRDGAHDIVKMTIKNLKTYYTRSNALDTKADSLYLIHKLFDNGVFIKGDMINIPQIKHTNTYLNNIENEQRPFVNKIKRNTNTNIWYADTETYVYDKQHEIQMIGYSYNDAIDTVIIKHVAEYETPQALIYSFLSAVTRNGTKDAIVYFHNLKYDITIMRKFLSLTNICKKDGQLYEATAVYKKSKIMFRCSLKMIPFRLAQFNKSFNLDPKYSKLEAIAYEYFTPTNYNVRIPTSEYRKHLSTKDQIIFDNVVTECRSYKDGEFNPIVFYKEYLKNDVLVLKHGFRKFNTLLEEITDKALSAYDALTISSFTDKYMSMRGCYEDIYECSANLKKYIAGAIYGGRVHVNDKFKKKAIYGKIADYDGVSLYPSAMSRLCTDYGIAKGPARRMSDFTLWESYDYCIMDVDIIAVNKKQQMPFICTNDGTLNYTNNVPKSTVRVDKYTLQDYIKYHEISYVIRDGVYWDGNGTNKQMGVVINELFQERLKYKKTNEALANAIKLMLNSAYGKTILRAADFKYTLINKNESEFRRYLAENLGLMRSYSKIKENTYEIELYTPDSSYNRAIAGCAILSTSKRIMNEVFDTANDLGANIYYTDTDSIHIDYDRIPELEEEYFRRYNRNLTGTNLGQFHVDFDLHGAAGDIYADMSIFLGKKSYFDRLVCTGNNTTGQHFRLKGITSEGVNDSAKKIGGYQQLYETLTTGQEMNICLNPYDAIANTKKTLFEFKNNNVYTRDYFYRTIRF